MLKIKLKRHFYVLSFALVLLIVTLLLITFLPTGFERINYDILKHPKALSQKQKVEDQILSGPSTTYTYGDEYAHYEPEIIGNYELTSSIKTGRPGDEGKAFILNSDFDYRAQKLKAEYGMNIAASEKIPVDRSVPDFRLNECKYWHYSESLPTASVVIVFHNEGLSILMRTVHSVLLKSPRKLLREVLLVDDYSDKTPLKQQLEDYILKNFGEFNYNWSPDYTKETGNQPENVKEKSGKVRLIRNEERGGLIRTRSRGAKEALGEVIVFLDAHCEVNYNWLPPLLAPIARNSKTITVPIIDGIDSDNFHYKPVYSNPRQHFQGIWEWGLFYKEMEVNMTEHLKTHKVSEPYESPTHAGGLFAINRQYFISLGTYDSGLLVWGGENFELSFKVWQCGGSLLWVPCSRVGHIYRPFMPYTFGSLAKKRKGPLILINYKRVVEVWWDEEFKNFFYTREPLAKFFDHGDIEEQLALKEKLQCKSFSWFMDRIGKVVFKQFPKLPANAQWGEIRSVQENEKCIDSISSSPPSLAALRGCHSKGGNQLFRLNEQGQLGTGERCMEANKNKMMLLACPLGSINGPWSYDGFTKQIRHVDSSGLTECLTFNNEDKLHLTECKSDENQKWIWRSLQP